MSRLSWTIRYLGGKSTIVLKSRVCSIFSTSMSGWTNRKCILCNKHCDWCWRQTPVQTYASLHELDLSIGRCAPRQVSRVLCCSTQHVALMGGSHQVYPPNTVVPATRKSQSVVFRIRKVLIKSTPSSGQIRTLANSVNQRVTKCGQEMAAESSKQPFAVLAKKKKSTCIRRHNQTLQREN